jgi:hypothetical protein
MKVTTRELRQAAQQLLDHLDGLGQDSFEIDEDYYWSVPVDSRYDPANTPSNLTIGQLSDDWNEIRAINDKKREPVGFALVWLAAILRRVGEKAVG